MLSITGVIPSFYYFIFLMINEEFASFANMTHNTMIEAYRLALAP